MFFLIYPSSTNIWPCQYDSAICAAAQIALSYWHGHAFFTKSNRH